MFYPVYIWKLTEGSLSRNTARIVPTKQSCILLTAKQVNDELADSITFNPATDFFWKSEWTGERPVNDADYAGRLSEGFYAYMNREYDFVFLITTAGGPYTVIPHFEILGA